MRPRSCGVRITRPAACTTFLQARIQVGIVVALTKTLLHALHQLLVDRVDLRQTERGDEGPDQPAAGQIDAFGKAAAQYGKADALSIGYKTGQKVLPFARCHVPGLLPPGNVRVPGDKAL